MNGSQWEARVEAICAPRWPLSSFLASPHSLPSYPLSPVCGEGEGGDVSGWMWTRGGKGYRNILGGDSRPQADGWDWRSPDFLAP